MYKGPLDDLDLQLIDRVQTVECRSIRDLIRPFLLERSESALRARVRDLQLLGKIDLQPTKRDVRCVPLEK